MFRKISDFVSSWQEESDATLKVLSALSDHSLTLRPSEAGRSVGEIAFHIVVSVGEMMGQLGIQLPCPSEDAAIPSKVTDLTEPYRIAAIALREFISQHWTEETLLVEKNMYGESWSNGKTLLALILHQTHHRAQLTVLMRQLGLRVPGVYGPAKEEWAAMHMPSPR